MADINVARKPAGRSSWLWALVAIAAVAALFIWIASQERVDTTPVVTEEADTAAVAPAAAGGDTAAVDTAAADTAAADTAATAPAQ